MFIKAFKISVKARERKQYKEEVMAKKKVEARSESIEVSVSPAWKLERKGAEVNIVSGCGCHLVGREGLTRVRISIEEI